MRTTAGRTRLWYGHVVIIVAAEFSAEAARGLVLPTLFSYAEHLGGDLAFVGVLTAVFSAGRFVASLLFGWLSDRVCFKALYYFSAAAAVVGNLLYVLPYSPRVNSKLLLGVSRFVAGFSAGNRSVCRANIASLTRLDQRLSYFTMLAAVVFLAYALTPGLGGIFGDVDVPVGGSKYVYFNRLTGPGFLLAGLNLATIALTAALYDDSVTREDAPTMEMARTIGNYSMVEQHEAHKPRSNPSERLCGILVFMFLNFNARGMLSIFETANVPLYLQAVNETSRASELIYEFLGSPRLPTRVAEFESTPTEVVAEASQFYLVIGLLGLITYAVIHRWGGDREKLSDVGLLFFGFAMLLVGNGVLVKLGRVLGTHTQRSSAPFKLFVLGEVLVWSVGSPIASAVIVPAFSKVLGTKPQGTLMGLFGASASVARMAMPLLPGLISSWELLFLVNIGLCVSCIAVLGAYIIAHRRARPPYHFASEDGIDEAVRDQTKRLLD